MPFELWLPAAIAVLFVGMSKGGVHGFSTIAVPVMSINFPPLQAAAILLPVLIAMDVFAVYRYRRDFDKNILKIIIPGALMGIFIGTLLFRYLPDDAIRFGVGAMSFFFGLYYWRGGGSKLNFSGSYSWGLFWSGLSGFTSFGIHAGGPPVKIYLLQQNFNRFVLSGTSAVYFAIVNLIKVGPYATLGYFSAENMAMTLWLLPLAPFGVFAGAYIVKRVSDAVIYKIAYIALMLIGVRLMLLASGY